MLINNLNSKRRPKKHGRAYNDELDRFKEINLVIERKRKQSQSAKNLGLSVRQAKRLCKNLRTLGSKVLFSKKRGSKGNYRLP